MKALFLGNSHLSAFKLAHNDLDRKLLPECLFYCAGATNLRYTKVTDGKLIPTDSADLCFDDFRYFMPELAVKLMQEYSVNRKPWGIDVRQQFVMTGGTEEIDLEDVGAIFYVCGISPYDFVRLGVKDMPITRSLWSVMLIRLLGSGFLLYEQISEIRKLNSKCRHYFIGGPLISLPDSNQLELKSLVSRSNRNIIMPMVKDYLFDDVYMPNEVLLDESLLGTKSIFCRGGVMESIAFQKVGVESQGIAETETDRFHMNKNYGSAVFRDFIFEKLIGI